MNLTSKALPVTTAVHDGVAMELDSRINPKLVGHVLAQVSKPAT
ncbi:MULTISPECIES: hypothetical protein [Micrococcaceae]|nr:MULTISPECIES: hypothetical protein [unclassified Kocuria]